MQNRSIRPFYQNFGYQRSPKNAVDFDCYQCSNSHLSYATCSISSKNVSIENFSFWEEQSIEKSFILIFATKSVKCDYSKMCFQYRFISRFKPSVIHNYSTQCFHQIPYGTFFTCWATLVRKKMHSVVCKEILIASNCSEFFDFKIRRYSYSTFFLTTL